MSIKNTDSTNISNFYYSSLLDNLAIDLDPRVERLLFKICYHASPALARVKSANLVTFRNGCNGNFQTDWRELCAEVKSYLPLDTFVLSDQKKGSHVLFYNREMLVALLSRPENKRYFEKLNYRHLSDLDSVLEQLKMRFTCGCPNEVGILLDYPLSDVLAFMNREKPCLLTGYWQVFSDLGSAKIRFNRYDQARSAFENSMACGVSPSRYLSSIVEM